MSPAAVATTGSAHFHGHARRTETPAVPFQPRVFGVSRVHVRPGERFASHLHAHLELILPENGLYRCRVGGATVEAQPGEAVLVNPGDAHEDPLSGPVTYFGCTFRLEPSPDAERSPSLFASDAPVATRHMDASASLGALSARVRAAHGTPPDSFAWAALDASCATWLWEVVARLPLALRSPVLRLPLEDELAVRLRGLLTSDPAEAVSVTELAARAGMHPRAFTDACRERFGLTPLLVRRRARCDAAATLLAQGVTVAETSRQLGFANPFHFSRVFRQAMGRPPSAWRC